MSSKSKVKPLTLEQVTPYDVRIKSGDIVVGRIWSMLEDGTTPYPHNGPEENIQVCGIERYVDTGKCGPFPDNTDMVIYFGSGVYKPAEEDYQPTFDFEKGDSRLETNEEILERLTEAECQPMLKISSPILG